MPSEASKAQKSERMKAWREANRDKVNAYQKQYREANKDSLKEYHQAYNAAYSKRDDAQLASWKRRLHRAYRMSHEDFNSLWSGQNGMCGICEIQMVPRGRSADAACVDHNHDTGEIRGLLCRGCNHGIGNLKDDPDVLEAAARYLREKGNYSSLVKNTGDTK